MRKGRALRLPSHLSGEQPIEQLRTSERLCEQVADLRIDLTNAIEALEDTVRQTEQILVRVPVLLRPDR